MSGDRRALVPFRVSPPVRPRALALLALLVLPLVSGGAAQEPDADGDGVPDAHDLKPRDPAPVRVTVRIAGYDLPPHARCDAAGAPDPYVLAWSVQGPPSEEPRALAVPPGWGERDHVDGRAGGEVAGAQAVAELPSDARLWREGGRPTLPWATLRVQMADHDLLRDDVLDLSTGGGVEAEREHKLHLDAPQTYLLTGDGRCAATLRVEVLDDAASDDVRRAGAG